MDRCKGADEGYGGDRRKGVLTDVRELKRVMEVTEKREMTRVRKVTEGR